MKVLYQCYQRCSGPDVHKKVVVARVMTPEGRETRSFGTTTGNLLDMAEWLASNGRMHVAIESPGVYSKPIYNILEGLGMGILVVNARDIKAVPGRKTDVKDAEWICDPLRHELLRGSFTPDRPQREPRELVRYRKGLILERAHEVNRIQKVLEGVNIKVGDVATDMMGKGLAILETQVASEADPESLRNLPGAGSRRRRASLLKP